MHSEMAQLRSCAGLTFLQTLDPKPSRRDVDTRSQVSQYSLTESLQLRRALRKCSEESLISPVKCVCSLFVTDADCRRLVLEWKLPRYNQSSRSEQHSPDYLMADCGRLPPNNLTHVLHRPTEVAKQQRSFSPSHLSGYCGHKQHFAILKTEQKETCRSRFLLLILNGSRSYSCFSLSPYCLLIASYVG